jgi:hypothetical protein
MGGCCVFWFGVFCVLCVFSIIGGLLLTCGSAEGDSKESQTLAGNGLESVRGDYLGPEFGPQSSHPTPSRPSRPAWARNISSHQLF